MSVFRIKEDLSDELRVEMTGPRGMLHHALVLQIEPPSFPNATLNPSSKLE